MSTSTHINTPFLPAEREALEKLARREGRSLGQQIRILAIQRLQDMGIQINPENNDPKA